MAGDPYNRRARVWPVLLAVAPVGLVLSAVFTDLEGLLKGAMGGGAAMAVSYLAGQLGRHRGKRREPALWRSWGGAPSVRFLRHRNTEFNSATRRRVHAKLLELGLDVPSRREEESDPNEADERYEACVDYVKGRTRDTTAFPRVLDELTSYGFRRNLWGLKPIGLTLAALGVAASGALLLRGGAESGQTFSPALLAALLGSAALLALWLLWVTPRTVRTTADQYARFLLEAVESL